MGSLRIRGLMPNGWETYVIGKNGFVGRNGISSGGIFGNSDGHTWASVKISATPDQITKMVNLFDDPSMGYTRGFELGTQRFTLLRIDPYDGFLQGRSVKHSEGELTCSIAAVRTNRALCIAIGEKDANGGSVSVPLVKSRII